MKKILGILGCTLSAFLLVSFIPSGEDDDLLPNPCANPTACPPGMDCIADIGNASYQCVAHPDYEVGINGQVCPNGGYRTDGERKEDRRVYSKIIEISSGATIDIVEGEGGKIDVGYRAERIMTTAYNCKGNGGVCWVCNRYVVF